MAEDQAKLYQYLNKTARDLLVTLVVLNVISRN